MGITNKIKKLYLAGVFVCCMLFAAGCGTTSFTDVAAYVKLGAVRGDALCVSSDRYAHNTLSKEQQIVYDEMLNAIMNMEETVRLSTTDKSDVKLCYDAICADYGEIFWVEACSYSELSLLGKPCAVSFAVEYAYTSEEVLDLKARMQPVIDEYLAQLAECESDYEKTEVVYRRLLQEVDYDMEAENNQNILSVFLGKKTVCQGYACAAQYLLDQAGIPCVIVSGTAQEQPHAWNMVKLDGAYYYLDVTWGNADFRGEKERAGDGINYGYLNITTEELLRSHQPQVDFSLRECDSIKNNYYVRNQLFFDQWDADAIGQKLADAFQEKRDSISVKFADSGLFAQAKEYFIDGRHITDYCPGISKIYYVPDKDLGILTIYF